MKTNLSKKISLPLGVKKTRDEINVKHGGFLGHP